MSCQALHSQNVSSQRLLQDSFREHCIRSAWCSSCRAGVAALYCADAIIGDDDCIQVVNEIVAFEVLATLMLEPSDDSIEIAVNFIKEAGAHLEDVARDLLRE